MTAGPTLLGTPAAPGRAEGPVFVAREAAPGAGEAAAGMAAVRAAAERAAQRLEELAGRRRAASPAAAGILEAQAMILRDPALEAAAEELLAGRPAAEAVAGAVERYAAEMDALDDPYLRERAGDVREAGRLLLAELAGPGSGGSRLAALARPSIVVARELSPADTLSVEPGHLLGLVTETGGRTSHTAIVARELGIPAVVGVDGAVAAAAGSPAAEVDGDAGRVRLLPAESGARRRGRALRPLDVAGAPVALMANVGSAPAALAAAARGAAGIGLFRTEFLFLGQPQPPPEDRQAEAYAAACRALHPHPVTIRTLDAGSDKALLYLSVPGEPNPALGRRGVRLWLAHRELWEPQVRALVRVASEHGNLRVMLPMIATREELRRARALFGAAARRRRASAPPLGMMVELPAAAAALDAFADLVDFVSIGTNDLGQYALGADRELDWPPGLGEFHPGVLRLIAACLEDAARLGLEAGACGEMAGQPDGAVFLTGAGARSLSMTAGSLAPVLRRLTRAGLDRCRAAAAAALAAADAAAARRALRRA